MNNRTTKLIRTFFSDRTADSPLIGICSLAVILCTACVSTEPPDQPSSAPVNMSLVDPGTITEAELDDQLRRFSDRFTTRMSVATDMVRGMDVTSTENAMLQSMYSVTFTTAVDIAIGPDPVTNLLDFMVLTTMMRLAAENNWVPVLFGPEKGAPILAAVKAAEQDVWSIADKVLTADEKRDLMLLIEEWKQQNPEQVYPWGIRMADFSGPRAARVSRVKQSGGLLREFRAARETAEEMQIFGDRVLFYMQRAPLITASVMEATTLDLLDSPDIRDLTSQSERFVVTAERLAATVEAIPGYRLAVVDQFMEGLGDERSELMGDIAAAAPATQALLVELRKTLEAAERITTELNIGDRLDEPVDIARLQALAAEATRTATEARLLVEALGLTMADAPTLIAALDTLILREQEIVDRTMIWLLAVIAFFFVLLIGYRLLVTRMVPGKAALLVLISCIAVLAQAQASEGETAPSDLRLDLELAIEAATKACVDDIARFCSDVTPGEGRLLACLQAYRDRVSEACDTALAQWQGPDVVADFQTTKLYPTLEMRELGEPNLDEDGERVIWPYRLPFMGQRVIDLGFDLPNPYGVALIPARIRQDLVLTDLAIGVNGPADNEIDFVDFGTPNVENNALQLKLDAWILPFMNVFTTIGVFDGKAEIPLKFEGSDLFPSLCNITPNNPVCVRTYSAIAKPGYEGKNIALGINLAMGWDRFFVTLPATYAWTDVDIIPQTVTAVNITPRIGMTGDMGNRGTVAAFIGATYLRTEVLIAGEVVLDTPGGPEGDQTLLAFQIRQRNKDRWNYLIGFNWEMNRHWSVAVEAGFGGSRENFIAGATYRF